MDRDRKNVIVLAICQTLFGTGRSLLIATAPVIAYGIAEHKELATLPHSMVIVGTAISTFPASLLMRRIGRRAGFVLGTLIGAIGGVISALGIMRGDFWLFSLGTLCFGFFAGFGQFYRFAAADAAKPEFKSKAISLVLAGGVVAGILGPELAKVGKDMFASLPFVGAYVLLCATMLISAAILYFLDIPGLTKAERAKSGRPILSILSQPAVMVAVLSSTIAQGVMNLLMTATPIAMLHDAHEFDSIALVIEWHVVGMFAPGFITGMLINRFGELRMIAAGLLLELACVGIALSGTGVFEFWLAMLLLGVGWNFAFTAGTTLLTTAYTPAERAKTEGTMNLVVYGFVATLSLSSGALVHYFGWTWTNLGALPLLAIAAAATGWYALYLRRAPAAAE